MGVTPVYRAGRSGLIPIRGVAIPNAAPVIPFDVPLKSSPAGGWPCSAYRYSLPWQSRRLVRPGVRGRGTRSRAGASAISHSPPCSTWWLRKTRSWCCGPIRRATGTRSPRRCGGSRNRCETTERARTRTRSSTSWPGRRNPTRARFCAWRRSARWGDSRTRVSGDSHGRVPECAWPQGRGTRAASSSITVWPRPD